MANTVQINGNTFTVPEMDFNGICELAELGIDIMNITSLRKNTIVATRSIVAWIAQVDIETAGDMIQQHIINGGSLEEIINVFAQALETSNFLNALKGRAEESNGTRRIAPQDHKMKQS